MASFQGNRGNSSRPSLLAIWLMAIRPKTLILSISPVLLAGLLALEQSAPVVWFNLPIIILSAMTIQIATNLWNDAIDATSGLDQAHERLGPPRVTSLGYLPAATVRKASVLSLVVASLCGLYLVISGGLPILVIGVVGIVCAFAYSSGPYPISASPYGEVFVVIFFGIMSVMGSFYLLTGEWAQLAHWAGLYIGLPAAAVLTVNNHRDRVGDEKGGRRTLAIQIGPQATLRLYAIFLLVSAMGLVHVFSFIDNGTLSLISLLVSAGLMIVALVWPIRQLFQTKSGTELNRCLASTSQFQLLWLGAFGLIQFLT